MPAAAPPPENSLLTTLIGLAEFQIGALFDRGTNLDTQALGLIAFDGALIALTVAAEPLLDKNHVLGSLWWVPIPGLVVSVVVAGLVTTAPRFDLGPSPTEFYENFSDKGDQKALEQLLVDVVETQKRSAEPLAAKTRRLIIALAALVLVAAYSSAISLSRLGEAHARRTTHTAVAGTRR